MSHLHVNNSVGPKGKERATTPPPAPIYTLPGDMVPVPADIHRGVRYTQVVPHSSHPLIAPEPWVRLEDHARYSMSPTQLEHRAIILRFWKAALDHALALARDAGTQTEAGQIFDNRHGLRGKLEHRELIRGRTFVVHIIYQYQAQLHYAFIPLNRKLDTDSQLYDLCKQACQHTVAPAHQHKPDDAINRTFTKVLGPLERFGKSAVTFQFRPYIPHELQDELGLREVARHGAPPESSRGQMLGSLPHRPSRRSDHSEPDDSDGHGVESSDLQHEFIAMRPGQETDKERRERKKRDQQRIRLLRKEIKLDQEMDDKEAKRIISLLTKKSLWLEKHNVENLELHRLKLLKEQAASTEVQQADSAVNGKRLVEAVKARRAAVNKARHEGSKDKEKIRTDTRYVSGILAKFMRQEFRAMAKVVDPDDAVTRLRAYFGEELFTTADIKKYQNRVKGDDAGTASSYATSSMAHGGNTTGSEW